MSKKEEPALVGDASGVSLSVSFFFFFFFFFFWGVVCVPKRSIFKYYIISTVSLLLAAIGASTVCRLLFLFPFFFLINQKRSK